MWKGKEKERKKEGEGKKREIANWREVRVVSDDDVGEVPIDFSGRKGELDGEYERRKKKKIILENQILSV